MAQSSDAVAWALAAMRVPSLWKRGWMGNNQLVASVDGGVDAGHPLLDGRVGAELAVDADAFGVRWADAAEPTAHATSVASLIVGGAVGGLSIGAAPGARLVSVAALGAGDVLARVLVGMDAAAEAGVGVICLPMGTRSCSPILAAAAHQLERRCGVLTVGSSGNDGPGAIRSPADFGDVLAVGACDGVGRVDERSGSAVTAGGRCVSPDVVAPGVEVLAATGRVGLAPVTGTSFAVALVAGVAALLRQAAPTASVAEVRTAIIASARQPIHEPRRPRSLAGLVDAAAAHDLLTRRRRFGAPRADDTVARKSVASMSDWVDPYLACLIDDRSSDEPLTVIVGCHDGNRVRQVIAAAQHASTVEPLTVVCQRNTATALVHASRRFVATLCERAEADLVSAARVPMAIPRRYNWR